MGQLMMGLVGALFLSTLVVLGQAMPCHAETKLIEVPLLLLRISELRSQAAGIRSSLESRVMTATRVWPTFIG